MRVNITKLNSHNAIFYFINDNRNTGKTTQMKKLALISNIKHNDITIWVRRFAKEFKQAKQNFINNKFMKVLKDDYPNKHFEKADFELKGNKLYYKGKLMIVFCCLSDAQSLKGVDELEYARVVFDEYTTTAERYKYFRGDEFKAFSDIFITAKRENQIRCYFLGNKETASNPYYDALGIDIKEDFNGIKKYRNGSVLVFQESNEAYDATSDYGKKLEALYAGTSYGAYLKGAIGNMNNANIKEPPKSASIYSCFDFGIPFTIYTSNDIMYAKCGIDKKRKIFTDKPRTYKKQYICHTIDKNLFESFIRHYKRNQVYVADAKSNEALYNFIHFFNL